MKAGTALYLQSTVHAREWLATTSLAWTMKRLAEGYGRDAVVTRLLDHCDVYIVPIVNVDGYIFTWETSRLWRKNRRDNRDGSFGVDINRNWGYVEHKHPLPLSLPLPSSLARILTVSRGGPRGFAEMHLLA